MEVRHAGKFFRFSLMKNGVEHRKWDLPDYDTNQSNIYNLLEDALNVANNEVIDLVKKESQTRGLFVA